MTEVNLAGPLSDLVNGRREKQEKQGVKEGVAEEEYQGLRREISQVLMGAGVCMCFNYKGRCMKSMPLLYVCVCTV